MSGTQEVFRVERRNPADPCSNVWEPFAAVDSFNAARASIMRHHNIGLGEIAPDREQEEADCERMQSPGEKWGFVRDGLHWRVINATDQDGGSVR